MIETNNNVINNLRATHNYHKVPKMFLTYYFDRPWTERLEVLCSNHSCLLFLFTLK